jgi:predicted metalloprotease
MQLFTGQAASPCGAMDGPFYCSADGGVVGLESEFMQTDLSAFGDFGAAVVVAHEIGHHTQALRGLLRVPSIFKELQADCLAGGWMKDAGARGLLEVSDPQEAAGSLFDVGDPSGTPWTHPDAHGTPQQRVEAFRIGFLQGVGSCEW